MRLSITFCGFAGSEAAEEAVRDCVALLSQVSDRVDACHVTVSVPEHGTGHTIQVELQVGGETLVVSEDSEPLEAAGWIYRTLGQAFRAARRRLGESLSAPASY